MTATKEVVEALVEFKTYIQTQLDEYERTGKTYYYPSPEALIGELDSRIDSLNDELYLKENFNI